MFWFPSTAVAPTVDGYGSYYAPAIELRGHPLAGMDLGDLWLGSPARSRSPATLCSRASRSRSATRPRSWTGSAWGRTSQRVIEEMVRRGIDPERLTYRAFGDRAPERTEDTPEAHAYNRRVVFVVEERAPE